MSWEVIEFFILFAVLFLVVINTNLTYCLYQSLLKRKPIAIPATAITPQIIVLVNVCSMIVQ